jgi:hypothetical protein
MFDFPLELIPTKTKLQKTAFFLIVGSILFIFSYTLYLFIFDIDTYLKQAEIICETRKQFTSYVTSCDYYKN